MKLLVILFLIILIYPKAIWLLYVSCKGSNLATFREYKENSFNSNIINIDLLGKTLFTNTHALSTALIIFMFIIRLYILFINCRFCIIFR